MNISYFQLKPKVARMAQEFIDKCAAEGISIAITEGFRTFRRQDQIYSQGRTTPGKIVTQAKGGYSMHNYAIAFDIVFVTKDGKKTYDGDWERVGKIGESVGLEHGDRGYKDLPHFQYRAGYSLSDFLNKRVDENRFV